MNKGTIKEILYILIAIILGIIAVKFIIWLLPIILIALCSYYVYKSLTKGRQKTKTQATKKKKIKIIDMVEEE